LHNRCLPRSQSQPQWLRSRAEFEDGSATVRAAFHCCAKKTSYRVHDNGSWHSAIFAACLPAESIKNLFAPIDLIDGASAGAVRPAVVATAPKGGTERSSGRIQKQTGRRQLPSCAIEAAAKRAKIVEHTFLPSASGRSQFERDTASNGQRAVRALSTKLGSAEKTARCIHPDVSLRHRAVSTAVSGTE
jgi:hypothetical protein